MEAFRQYASHGFVVEQEKTQNDCQKVDPVVVAGQDDQHLPKDGDPGCHKTPPARQKHHEGHKYLDDERSRSSKPKQPFRKLLRIPGQRRGQWLYFEVIVQGGEAGPGGILHGQLGDPGHEP